MTVFGVHDSVSVRAYPEEAFNPARMLVPVRFTGAYKHGHKANVRCEALARRP